MPLKPPSQPPTSSAEWDRWARSVPVEPDPGSVGEGQLQDNSITEPKYGDVSVSTRVLADESVTDQKLRDSNALSVMGRASNSNGTPTDISAPSNGTYMRRKGDVLEFAAIDDADIPASIARDTEVSAAVTAHEAALDPHTQYLTQTEGDARYRELTDAVTYTEITGKPAALALIFSGTGSPETVVTAGIGSTYHRTDGGAGTSFWVKESGAGTNTGWVAK